MSCSAITNLETKVSNLENEIETLKKHLEKQDKIIQSLYTIHKDRMKMEREQIFSSTNTDYYDWHG
jgi:chaperonin cofactor prefoldin